jgi:exonuclease VII small subunit
MTQPKIEGVGHGIPRMLFASDGSDWYAILVDSDGHVKVDVVSAALPTGAATETTLASLLAELAYKLETGDLSLEAVTKYLNVVVKTSALPTDAATQTTLALVKTAVEKIDDLQGALGSVATDILRVASKSGDKIFGFESVINDEDATTFAGGSTRAASDAVPTGKVWVITHIGVRNNTRAMTSVIGGVAIGGTSLKYTLYDSNGEAQYFPSTFTTQLWLAATDKLGFDIGGGLDGDTIQIHYSGYQMNQP